MPARKSNPPRFLVIAGPNGSGKTTAYERSIVQLRGRALRIINPDRLAKRLESFEKISAEKANLEAVSRIEQWLETSILAGHSVGVETVLSTGKYRRLVDKAKFLGFEIQLIYVVLDNPDLNVQRVALRVRRGGHSVPEEKIRTRYVRSLAQLPWFFEQADMALLFDNSGATPRLVGEKAAGLSWIDVHAPDNLAQALTNGE
ncbi:MAG TPA: AAA family ATPase [Sphingomicrobium sp.]|nr:AAA family ATPase [Sphingomicrobium sp.]